MLVMTTGIKGTEQAMLLAGSKAWALCADHPKEFTVTFAAPQASAQVPYSAGADQCGCVSCPSHGTCTK